MKQNKKAQLVFRNEWKHSMDHMDYIIIRSRLAEIADESLYAGLGGSYRVRSLAFTEPGAENRTDILSSIGRKESFRIRYYNENKDYIRLEKKTRVGGKTNKQSAVLTEQECRDIIDGRLDWMAESEEPLVVEFYAALSTGKIEVQTVADYQREAFVYRPCNVRITLDSGLKAGISPDQFFSLESEPSLNAAEARKEAVIMEVKYDCFLPEIIRAAIRVKERKETSFARYEARHAFGQV